MSLSNNYPDIRPVWMNDYSNAGVIDPRCSFIRSDTPPSYAAPSDVHYWSDEDHLSSENLLKDSKTGTGNWAKFRAGVALLPTITADHAAPPAGGDNAATRVQLDLNGGTSTGDYAIYYQTLSIDSGTSGTFSVWLRSTDGTSTYTAQIISSSGAASAVTVTGSWQKFVVTASSFGANITYGLRLRADQTPANSATADILMWGAQLSTLGETVLNETTTQIHREYAATLKPVSYSGQPRFEYEPTGDREAKGLLIESSSTNLATYSEDSTQWSKAYSTLEANAGVAPDGSTTATLWTPSTTTNSHYVIHGTISATSGTTYTGSVFLKAAGTTRVQLTYGGVGWGGGYANISLTGDGSVLATGGTASATVVACGNGWYRATLTEDADATATSSALIVGYINSDSSSRLPSVAASGYEGVLVWGFQTEAYNFSSSYISSSGSASTRSSDSLSFIDDSIFEGGEHSIYWEGSVNGSISDPRFMELSDGTTSNRIQFFYNDGSKVMLRTSVDGVSSIAAIQVTEPITASVKLMATLKTAEARVVSNGTTITSSTSDSFYSPSGLRKINIGTNYAQGAQLDGHVKRVAVFSESLTEVEAQSLTS